MLGMNQGLMGQIKTQWQSDFMDIYIIQLVY
jgi:hypothetical protein